MRIVIDLQCSSHEWPVALMLAGAVARHRGDHEVFILLNAAERARVTQTRAVFHDILPTDALRLWFAPDDLMSWKPAVEATRRKATEHIRLAALAALEPDVLLLTGQSDGYRENCAADLPFAVDLPTAVLLQPAPTTLQDTQNSTRPFAYLRNPVETFVVTLERDALQENLAELAPSNVAEVSLSATSLQNAVAPEWENAAHTIISRLEAIMEGHQETHLTETLQRPRLAFVSPLPPEKSGIAEYSAQLLPELARYYDIELIVDRNNVSDPRLDGVFAVRSAEWFKNHSEEFDRVLYHFGNSPPHEYMHGLLQKVPGIVVLHDFYLRDWQLPGRIMKNIDFILRNHGIRALIDIARLTPAELAQCTFPANLETIQNATGVIVHNAHPCTLASQWYGPAFASDWHVVPLLRPAADFTQADRADARRRLGFAPDDLVICSFGHITHTKLSGQILSAFKKSNLSASPKVRLVFVGELEAGYADDFNARNTSKQGQIAHVTGWVDSQGYIDHLLAADIAVQLRGKSRGETSASVLDCLNYGIPTIVNAHGSMQELDPDTVLRIADPVVEADLLDALKALADDRDRRIRIGSQAKKTIGEIHAPTRCATLYQRAIEFSSRPARRTLEKLPERLAALPLSEVDHLPLARTMGHNFPATPRRRILFVDVSVVVHNDIHTGIQRVARAILKELMLQSDTSCEIVPVRFMPDGSFSTVFAYAQKILDLPFEKISEYTIDVSRGDLFLVLDLDFGQNEVRRRTLERFQDAGAAVWHVVYDLLPIRKPQYFPSRELANFADWLDMVTAFDGAACISAATADDLKKWIQENTASSHEAFDVSWFHLGADFESSVPTRGVPDNAAKILAFLGEKPTFLMVGTVEPRKGHAQTVAAFERLWAEGLDINLAIVGKEGWKMKAFCTHLRNHPELEKRLFWFDNISDEYLEKLYAVSTCLIAASEGEGFGLPLIEAAQHRLPILARGLGVFREIAGPHAVYFDGLEPEDLAEALREWTSDWRAGKVVSSAEIPWLTWRKSAMQLRQAIGLSGKNTQDDEEHPVSLSDIGSASAGL